MPSVTAMINTLVEFIRTAVTDYMDSDDAVPQFSVNIPAREEYGDFSTGVAFSLAPAVKKPPFEIASGISKKMQKGIPGIVSRIDVIKPGYINFFMDNKFWHAGVKDIVEKNTAYGKNNFGQGKRILVEFISANPTGPVHVGHGRGAVVGDVLARVLAVSGYHVTREYYINDAGNQVLSLGYSVLNEYYRLNGIDTEVSRQGEYAGEYIKNISDMLGSHMPQSDINEEHIRLITGFAADVILDTIKQTLLGFGVGFDSWFSEKSLYEDNSIPAVIQELEKKNAVSRSEGATWFLSTLYGDEKDRVLQKQSGELTYFASDIAYHVNKYKRGYDMLVNVWGADHHGYLPRIMAALRALGYDPAKVIVLFVQMVRLMRGDKPVAMSKRAGEYVTLKELVDEVGSDAVRFFFLQRSHESQLVFDIELAKKQSQENPVYYVQYAHARIASIFVYARTKGWDVNGLTYAADYVFGAEEKRLIAQCLLYPQVIMDMAVKMEPHRLTHYLIELVGILHKYYTDTRVVGDDSNTGQRLLLMKMVKIVLKNALDLLGINAPEKM